MFKKLTYKNKVIYLLVGFFVFFIIVYNLAIKKTVNIFIENSRISEQLSNLDDAPVRIQLIEKRIKQIDQAIGESISLDKDLHKQLLERVGGYCKQNNITLRDFPAVHQISKQDYMIQTSQFIVEGTFIKILKLIKLLETDYRIGKVSSVKYYSMKNPKTNRISLYAKIYLQNIKKNE